MIVEFCLCVYELRQMPFVNQSRLALVSVPFILRNLGGCPGGGGRLTCHIVGRWCVCVTLGECETEFNSCFCVYYLST